MENHSKEENPDQLLSIKRRIFQRFSASNVRSLDTMLEISLCRRIESRMPPSVMLTKSHPRRSKGKK
jgi:hypothetical protein